MRRPLLYLVRHGSTTDSGLNIFRGQRDSALDKKGFLDAHALKDFFQDREWHRIFCSKMTRAIQTATIICDDQDEYQPETVADLEPWDIGVWTGQPKNEKNSAAIKYFDSHMNEAPEGGESIYQFEARIWPLFAAMIELGWKQGVPVICVAHSSIVHSLNHFLEGHFDHKEKAVKPGGVVEVYMEDGEILHQPILKSGHDDSSFQKS